RTLRPPTPTLFPYTTLFRSLLTSQSRITTTLAAASMEITVPEPFFKVCRRAGPRSAQIYSRRCEFGGRHCRGYRAGAYSQVLEQDRKSTRLNSSHVKISYAV